MTFFKSKLMLRGNKNICIAIQNNSVQNFTINRTQSNTTVVIGISTINISTFRNGNDGADKQIISRSKVI